MGALDNAFDDGEDDYGTPTGAGETQLKQPGMMGGLAALGPQQVSFAVSTLNRQALDFPWSAVDEFRKRYDPQFKKAKEEHDMARAALQTYQPPVDERVPWLKAAQGLLSPTRTGSFAESLGAGAGAFADARSEQNKQEIASRNEMMKLGLQGAQQNVQDTNANAGMDIKFGTTMAALERARMAMMTNRFKVVPTRGLVDTMDLDPQTGAPKVKIPTISLQQMFTQAENNIRKSLSGQTIFQSPQDFENEVKRQLEAYKTRIMSDPDAAMAGLVTSPSAALSNPQQPGATIPPAGGGQPPAGGLGQQPGAATSLAGSPAAPGAVPQQPMQQPQPQMQPAQQPPVQRPGSSGQYQKGSPELALQHAYAEAAGKGGQEYEQGLQQGASAGALQNYLLDSMQKDLKNLGDDPGKLMGLRAAISQWKVTLGIGSPEDQKLAANAEASTKMSGQLLSAWLKSLSSRPSQMEFVIAADKFIPTGSMTPQGAEKVINAMRATSNRSQHQYETFVNEWKPGHTPEQYGQHQMYWQQKYGTKFPLESESSYPVQGKPPPAGGGRFKVLGVEGT